MWEAPQAVIHAELPSSQVLLLLASPGKYFVQVSTCIKEREKVKDIYVKV